MAKLSWNAFIEKHGQGTCVQLHFRNYVVMKELTKRKIVVVPTGKILPTPNEIARALGKAAKGDFNQKSENGGADQLLMFSDATQAAAIINRFPHERPRLGNGNPILSVTKVLIEFDRQTQLAKELGLL